jgi:hypothetical protein
VQHREGDFVADAAAGEAEIQHELLVRGHGLIADERHAHARDIDNLRRQGALSVNVSDVGVRLQQAPDMLSSWVHRFWDSH